LIELSRRMLSDASKYIAEPSLRVHVIEASGLDQGLEDGRALAATIGSAEQPGLTAEWHAAQGTFGGVIGQADPAVVEEAGEGVPTPEHVVDGLGEVVVARQPGELGGEPCVQLGHERRTQFLAHSEPLGRVFAVNAALDIEQGIDPLHGLERDRIDHAGMIAAALLAGCAGDVGQFEELAPRVGKAAGLEHGRTHATGSIELAVAAIGVSLQNA